MVESHDFREIIYGLLLIGGLSVYGLLAPHLVRMPTNTLIPDAHVASAGVPLVVNPVVSITVPEHTIFAP